MLQTCWYVDLNDREFYDFERAFEELVELGLVDSIQLNCLTYQQAEMTLGTEYPTIVIIHPSGASKRAKKLCGKLLELGIAGRWTYSAENPGWPDELTTRHYQKPLSLQLLLRELQHYAELNSQTALPENDQPLERRLSTIEKKLSFPVGYWDMGGYLIEDPYKPAYLNEYWEAKIGCQIDDSLANQIRTVSIRLFRDHVQPTTIIRKQRFRNKKTNSFQQYNVLFSQVYDSNKRWLRIELFPEEEKKHDGRLEIYLENMAQTLAESYGISRLRLYETQKILMPRGTKENLLTPLASFGGGHSTTSNQEIFKKWQYKEELELSKWLKESFLYECNGSESVFEAPRFELITSKNELLCSRLGLGGASNHFLKLIFDYEKGAKAPIALLVIDKRLDHIKKMYRKHSRIEQLSYMKHMEVFVETALGEGSIHNEMISRPEIDRMSTTLEAFCSGISRRLQSRSEETYLKLNFKIFDDLATATDKYGLELNPAKKILRYFLATIPNNWIEAQPSLPLLKRNLHENQLPDASHYIDNVYVAILRYGRWYLLAGHGEYVSGIVSSWKSDELFNRIANNLTSAVKTGDIAEPVVMHDFQSILNKSSTLKMKIARMIKTKSRESIDKTNSWLGIPIHLAGGAKAAFIFHAQMPYYFSDTRIKYLETLARRTISLINWSQFEDSTIEYEQSLRHEILTPLSALPEEVKRSPQIILVRNFIENLALLQQNTKVLGSGNFKESFAHFEHLNLVYDGIFRWPKKPIDFICTLPQVILDQVLYIFLSNAGKYAAYDTVVNISISSSHKKCLIKIENKTDDIIFNIESLYEPKHRGQNSGVNSGGGLGLYVLRKLQELYDIDTGINFNMENKLFTAYIKLEELES